MVAVATSRALGTGVQVAVTEDGALPAADAAVRDVLAAIDLAASRFRDDSELFRINREAGRPVPVSPLCLRAVQTALRVAVMTGGLVDPTVGRSLEALGYDRDFSAVAAKPAHPARAAAGWREVEVDEQRSTVRLPAGALLDLGSSAKALAADDAAARAAGVTGCGVLVNLGGDLTVAGMAPDGGWEVLVTDDHAAPPDAPGQVVHVHSGGLATSSTTVRRWTSGGRSVHHIVDPHTGEPAATVWRTVSVTAPSCVDANAAATAAIVIGEDAPQWLLDHGFAARLVDASHSVHYIGGWPEAGERR